MGISNFHTLVLDEHGPHYDYSYLRKMGDYWFRVGGMSIEVWSEEPSEDELDRRDLLTRLGVGEGTFGGVEALVRELSYRDGILFKLHDGEHGEFAFGLSKNTERYYIALPSLQLLEFIEAQYRDLTEDDLETFAEFVLEEIRKSLAPGGTKFEHNQYWELESPRLWLNVVQLVRERRLHRHEPKVAEIEAALELLYEQGFFRLIKTFGYTGSWRYEENSPRNKAIGERVRARVINRPTPLE